MLAALLACNLQAAPGASTCVQEHQAAGSVELQQVVNRSGEAPLGGWLAADQDLLAILDGADLPKHRLDDRLAPLIDSTPFFV